MNHQTKIKKSMSRPQSGAETYGNIPTAAQGLEPDDIQRKDSSGGTVPADKLAGIRPGRIAAYARVSTQRQEQDETINSQIAAITALLKSSGQEIADEDIYIDEGFSGSSMVRPGLDKLRDAVATRRYDMVLVLDPDRLARKYVYQMLLVEEFERNDCMLHFIRCSIGTTPDEACFCKCRASSRNMSGRKSLSVPDVENCIRCGKANWSPQNGRLDTATSKRMNSALLTLN